MDKLQMAHEYALEMAKQGIPLRSCLGLGWKYADAMQAEADKRVNKERQVDWTQAPKDAIGWMIFDGVSTWLGASGYLIEDAPSFGFTGSHVVERPHGF